uniref:Fibrinogen C-terminal domain-containing protein n=1 Tax=Amphimedon queenslandica TaxID=400682 RepID=A0A1X7TUJ8_AMPQE
MEVKGKYEDMAPLHVRCQENPYELTDITTHVRRNGAQTTEEVTTHVRWDGAQSTEEASQNKSSKQLTWKTAFIVMTMLQCLVVFLLVVILCLLLVQFSARDASTSTTSTTGAIAGNVASPNFTEWSDNIVNKVNSNVTGSLPDFNEWANGVAQNTFQLFQSSPNFTELDEQILQTTRDSAQKLINIVNTLSNLQDTSTSTAGVVDDILLVAYNLLLLHNDSSALPSSCKEIKERQPLSPSGVYLLSNTSSTYTAYCNMEELCNSTGGWTRLAYLDMTDATQNCPSGFGLYQSGGVRACGKQTLHDGCVSVQFPSHDISYSQVCGRVTGYTFGSINGLNSAQDFDGVIITQGPSRQKVWSFIAGQSELGSSCPCSTGSSGSVPASIGNNYFCESGVPNNSISQILYTSDPLWDGQGCGSLEAPCCNVPGIPWFHRDYGSTTTTDYIELRVCADYDDEDSPVSYYEIYIK